MKNPKTITVALGALVVLAVGFLFFRSPKPIIEIKAEKIVDIGPFPLVNTYVTSFTVMVLLIVFAYMVTRKLHLIPGPLQNAVEAVTETLYNICIQTAGEKNGRRFFPVAATFFVFIWIANWMALLPFFNAIGTIEEVSPHRFHEEALIFEKSGPIGFIVPNQKEIEFEVDEDEIAALKDEDEKEAAYEAAILETLEKKEGIHASTFAEAEEQLKADGKQLGILIPTFRSMNTDINSPLSFALTSVIFVEFWGITTLGFFKYGSKFITFRSPVAFIVGLLELVAEVARIISFTFRLFGNMLAGEILLLVMTFLVPFLVTLPFYGLELFVGMIQAFVLFILTIAFGALAVASHDEHDAEHAGVHAEAAPAH